jgi:hypothetical protein
MKNKIFVISTLLAGLFIANSCLKDTADYWKDDVAGKSYATVLVPQLQSKGLKPEVGDVFYSFMINIATDALPTKDITVTMKKDDDAVVALAARTGKNYQAFPNVEILNPTVVIAKGTRTATINCRVWGAESLDACANFVAAVSFATISDPSIVIAENMKSYLLSLPISNPYQGSYIATGTFTHPTAGVRPINEPKELTTVDCKTVHTTVGDLGGYDAYFEVQPDNSVKVTGGLSAAQPLVQDLTKPNTYDPATKTFTVNYYYVGAGGNRVISEVLVKTTN